MQLKKDDCILERVYLGLDLVFLTSMSLRWPTAMREDE